MKLVFALSMMAILMVADATMYKITQYSGSGCEGSPVKEEYIGADICMDMRAACCTSACEQHCGSYIKVTCSTSGVTVTGYTDAGCSTVNTTFHHNTINLMQPSGRREWTDGVWAPGSKCMMSYDNVLDMDRLYQSQILSCPDQPSQVKIEFFSDANCASVTNYELTSGKSFISAPARKIALDVCTFAEGEIVSGVRSLKRTVSGGVMTTKSYATKDCTGTSTDGYDFHSGYDYQQFPTNGTFNIGTCTQITNFSRRNEAPITYAKQDSSGVITAAQAQALVLAPAPPPGSTNTTNSTAAPKATSSGVSLPYSIIASVLSVVASAAVSI